MKKITEDQENLIRYMISFIEENWYQFLQRINESGEEESIEESMDELKKMIYS